MAEIIGVVTINARIYKYSNTGKNAALKIGGAALGAVSGFLVGGPLGAIVGAGAGWALGTAASDDDTDAWADKTVYRCSEIEYIRTLMSFGTKYVYLQKGTGIYAANTDTDYTTDDTEDNDETEEESMETSQFWGYLFLYILLVVETCMFLYTYLKRVIKLAFYTMIAPLIAFMYPIDKLGDGKAQAFNKWFKEYLFNVLIQPLHLLLYIVFIYSGMELMNTSVIYGIVAYAYMIAAEKFVKEIFGFNKAPMGGPGGLASPMAGHEAMRGLDRLSGTGPGSKKNGKGSSGDSSSSGKIHQYATKPKASNAPSSSGGTNSVTGGTGRNSSSSGTGGALTGGSNSGGVISSGGGRAPASGGGSGQSLGFFRSAAKNQNRKIAGAITGGRANNLSSALKNHKGDIAKTGGKFVGKKLVGGVGRVAGGLAGAAVGAGAGLVLGGMASALTGEDNVSKGLQTGIYSGGKVGWNRGGQLADGAVTGLGDWYKETKEYQASENGGGDYTLAGKLQYDEIAKNNPELFGDYTDEQREEASEILEHGSLTGEELALAMDYKEANNCSAEEAFMAGQYSGKFDLGDTKGFENAVGCMERNEDLGYDDNEVEQRLVQMQQEAQAKMNNSQFKNYSDNELKEMEDILKEERSTQRTSGTYNTAAKEKYEHDMEMVKEAQDARKQYKQSSEALNGQDNELKQSVISEGRTAKAREKVTNIRKLQKK